MSYDYPDDYVPPPPPPPWTLRRWISGVYYDAAIWLALDSPWQWSQDVGMWLLLDRKKAVRSDSPVR